MLSTLWVLNSRFCGSLIVGKQQSEIALLLSSYDMSWSQYLVEIKTLGTNLQNQQNGPFEEMKKKLCSVELIFFVSK